MAIVQTFAGLQAMSTPRWYDGPSSSSGINVYGRQMSYAMLYATQPNVRTCVDFLSRNIAELALHAFRRIDDTDRERLVDHELIRWLGAPSPSTRRYRLMEALVADLGIYFNAYWWKIRRRDEQGRESIGLVRLPPHEMSVEGGLLKSGFTWTSSAGSLDLALRDVVHFDGYNPLNPLEGLSPLATLRRILSEEAAAGEHRESYWRNAGRHEGMIELAKDGPNYTEAQLKDIGKQLREFSAGGDKVGRAPILPKGLTYKSSSFSPRESEYSSARKLTREECAAAYHIPLPLVGILDHATFSNIREQHKHLYQDTLGPWLRMIKEEIEGQLLIECEDTRDVYTEFNIAAKLAGNFEEQAASLQLSVGRPFMTANEARARLNLPRITDDPTADTLAAQQGGPSDGSAFAEPRAPQDPAPPVRAVWQRQATRLAKVAIAERPAQFDRARWDRELTSDLTPVMGPYLARLAAIRINDDTYTALLAGEEPFTPDRDRLLSQASEALR